MIGERTRKAKFELLEWWEGDLDLDLLSRVENLIEAVCQDVAESPEFQRAYHAVFESALAAVHRTIARAEEEPRATKDDEEVVEAEVVELGGLS